MMTREKKIAGPTCFAALRRMRLRSGADTPSVSAEGQRQSAERHDVRTDVQVVHRDEGRQHRDRQRENRNQRRAKMKQEEDDDNADDDRLFEQVAL